MYFSFAQIFGVIGVDDVDFNLVDINPDRSWLLCAIVVYSIVFYCLVVGVIVSVDINQDWAEVGYSGCSIAMYILLTFKFVVYFAVLCCLVVVALVLLCQQTFNLWNYYDPNTRVVSQKPFKKINNEVCEINSQYLALSWFLTFFILILNHISLFLDYPSYIQTKILF